MVEADVTGTVMLKPLSAILAAAVVAALATFVSAPGGPVTAGPLASADGAAMQACAQRPWPYLHCVGTPFGNHDIRLVTTDILPD
jgi:hypothetical protein